MLVVRGMCVLVPAACTAAAVTQLPRGLTCLLLGRCRTMRWCSARYSIAAWCTGAPAAEYGTSLRWASVLAARWELVSVFASCGHKHRPPAQPLALPAVLLCACCCCSVQHALVPHCPPPATPQLCAAPGGSLRAAARKLSIAGLLLPAALLPLQPQSADSRAAWSSHSMAAAVVLPAGEIAALEAVAALRAHHTAGVLPELPGVELLGGMPGAQGHALQPQRARRLHQVQRQGALRQHAEQAG